MVLIQMINAYQAIKISLKLFPSCATNVGGCLVYTSKWAKQSFLKTIALLIVQLF